MTKEEIFKKHLKQMRIAKNPPVSDEELDDFVKDPEIQFVIKAMQEYTDQQTSHLQDRVKELETILDLKKQGIKFSDYALIKWKLKGLNP